MSKVSLASKDFPTPTLWAMAADITSSIHGMPARMKIFIWWCEVHIQTVNHVYYLLGRTVKDYAVLHQRPLFSIIWIKIVNFDTHT